MKIQDLNFSAFGPFTNKSLAFGQEKAGFHIIFGPNEAGKSSALRGLKAFLYGIETRSLDNFIHAHDKLRIMGCLRSEDGQELEFTRRKGRKNTLLDAQGNNLDENVLQHYLQGITAELFNSLFGIDHQALLQGGREILQQKGEVGQTLFSAALGSHAVHSVLEDLDDEANSLFLPRGSKQIINSALKTYAELKKEIADCSLSSANWEEHQQSLQKISDDLAAVEFQLAANRKEINRLKRIQRVLPKLARRSEFYAELNALGEVVLLSDDFPKRHQQSVHELETAKVIVQKINPRLAELQQQLDELSINQNLLMQAEKIEDFHARLGSHRKAKQDLPQLKAEREQKLNDAEFLLKDVRPDLQLKDIEILRPLLIKKQMINELGNKYTLLSSRVEQAETSQREIEKRLISVRKERNELTESASAESLHRSIISARKLGDIDSLIQSKKSEFETLQTQCVAEFSRLTLLQGDIDEDIETQLNDLPGLKVPKRESINQFENSYDELDKRVSLLREKQESVNNTLYDTLLDLDEFQRIGDVPTEMELLGIRTDRESVWKLLRRQWLDGDDVSSEASRFSTVETLPDTFEEKVSAADELSDRLRREADRVTKVANLQATEKSMQLKLRDLSDAMDECILEQEKMNTKWQEIWISCQIHPESPREMKAWLDNFIKLREHVDQLTIIKQKINELEKNRLNHIELLNQELKLLGKEYSKANKLETVLLECEDFMKQMLKTNQKHALLKNEIKNLENDFDSFSGEYQLAKQEFAEWKTQWKELIANLGLYGDLSPAEMDDVIDNVRELFAKQNEAENLHIKIKANASDAELFKQQVMTLISDAAPELKKLSIDDAVLQLNKQLSDNRSSQTQSEQLKIQLQQAQIELQESKAIIKAMKERLDELCSEAQCKSHTDLEIAQKLSIQYAKLKADITSIEQEILEAGEGSAIDKLEVEVKGIDADTLPVTIKQLSNKIDDELEPRRTDLAQTKGRKEKELDLMDGSDKAARLAEQAQAVLAGIRLDSERYVRATLAAKILRDEIESYRQENQGPLIIRAGEHFSRLTLGSFDKLMTDFNEKDEPILTGVRPGGEKVFVEGMSSGTRDQLYLALRLASLEKYMETSEPMPFIVDDILVDFDDDRSEAALTALSVLAEKTQVILFTHHSRCVEQARRIQGSSLVEIHEL